MAGPMQGGMPAGAPYMSQQQQYGMMPQPIDSAGMHQQDGHGGSPGHFVPMLAPAQIQHQQHGAQAQNPQASLMQVPGGEQDTRDAGKHGDEVGDVLTLDSGAGFDSNIGGVPEDMDDFLSVLSKDPQKDV